MKAIQISAGRERSIALTVDGSAYSWGNVKRIGATLPPGYPGELCTSNPTEIRHNRYAQPEPQLFKLDAPFATVSDGYADTLAADRTAWCSRVVRSCRKRKERRISQLLRCHLLPTQLAVAESGLIFWKLCMRTEAFGHGACVRMGSSGVWPHRLRKRLLR